MTDRFDHALEHTLKTKPDEPGGDDAAATPVRRIEVITESGPRRRWVQDDKARIVVESLRPGACVSEVARRHGLSPQQLFGWRREMRSLMAGSADAAGAPDVERASRPAARPERGGARAPAGAPASAERVTAFAPVVVATCAAAPPAPPPPPPTPPASGSIEIAIGDAIVRVLGQVEPATLTAVLRAVRRAT